MAARRASSPRRIWTGRGLAHAGCSNGASCRGRAFARPPGDLLRRQGDVPGHRRKPPRHWPTMIGVQILTRVSADAFQAHGAGRHDRTDAGGGSPIHGTSRRRDAPALSPAMPDAPPRWAGSPGARRCAHRRWASRRLEVTETAPVRSYLAAHLVVAHGSDTNACAAMAFGSRRHHRPPGERGRQAWSFRWIPRHAQRAAPRGTPGRKARQRRAPDGQAGRLAHPVAAVPSAHLRLPGRAARPSPRLVANAGGARRRGSGENGQRTRLDLLNAEGDSPRREPRWRADAADLLVGHGAGGVAGELSAGWK